MPTPVETGHNEHPQFLYLTDEKYQIRKRDGKIVPFDQERITQAIYNAMKAVDWDDHDEAIRSPSSDVSRAG